MSSKSGGNRKHGRNKKHSAMQATRTARNKARAVEKLTTQQLEQSAAATRNNRYVKYHAPAQRTNNGSYVWVWLRDLFTGRKTRVFCSMGYGS